MNPRLFASFRALSLATLSALPLACMRTPADVERDYARTLRPAALEVPAAIAAGRDTTAEPRVIRVRVYADANYRKENIRWRERATKLLEDASSVIAPQLGITFKAVGVVPWERAANETELSTAVGALAELDRGEDVDLVLGLTGALPAVSAAHDVLGYAQSFGAHAVIRNMESTAEAEALRAVFRHLPADEREALYRARKQHKEVSVFLHEWAHTLGAFHVSDSRWMMAPLYEAHQARFAPETLELLETTLRHYPQSRRSREAQRALGAELVILLERLRGPEWEGPERDGALAWANLAARGEAPLRMPPVLSPADERTFNEAVRAHDAGRFEIAASQLIPLARRNPEHERIQVVSCMAESHVVPAAARKRCEEVTRRFPEQPFSALALARLQLTAGEWEDGHRTLTLARERLTGKHAEHRNGWEQLASLATVANQVTWAEEALRVAGPGRIADEVKAWAIRVRRWSALSTEGAGAVTAEREGHFVRETQAIGRLMDQGALGKARAAIAGLGKEYPGAAMHDVLTCELQLRSSRPARARSACEAALKLAPEAVHAHYLLSLAALQSGKRPEAVDHLRRVIELEPTHRDAWTTLAELYRATGRKLELASLKDRYRAQFAVDLP